MHDPDIRKIAVSLVIIQPVSDDKLVRNLESLVVDIDLAFPSVRLVQQRTKLYGSRLSALKVFQQIAQGVAGIDDVLHNEHVLVHDRIIQILDQLDDAG